MTTKNLALLSGVACVAVLATYAWAASQDAAAIKSEEAAVEVEASAEPAALCIPMAEANDAAATETSETSVEGKAEVASSEESTEEVKTEAGATDVEAALPICDENGNPPAAEAAASGEVTEKAAEEPAKTE